MAVIYTTDGDELVVYVQDGDDTVSYGTDTDNTASYTQDDDLLLYDLLVDIDRAYIVDSLGTRINLGGGYEQDGDDAVIYTVAS